MALLSYSDASLSKWVKRFNSDRRGGETGSPPPPLPLTSLCSGPLRLHLARLCPDVFRRASVGGGGGRRVCARGAIKTAHMREKERDGAFTRRFTRGRGREGGGGVGRREKEDTGYHAGGRRIDDPLGGPKATARVSCAVVTWQAWNPFLLIIRGSELRGG